MLPDKILSNVALCKLCGNSLSWSQRQPKQQQGGLGGINNGATLLLCPSVALWTEVPDFVHVKFLNQNITFVDVKYYISLD